MKNMYVPVLVIVLAFSLTGCGSSGGSESGDSTVSGGGSAYLSPDGTGGDGGGLQITSLGSVIIGGTTGPSYTSPQHPTPPQTGYIILEDDRTLSQVLADPSSNSLLVGDTVEITGNLIIGADTTLFVDQANWKIAVSGDLVVYGYLSSKLASGPGTPIDITVTGDAYIDGYIDNTPVGDGSNAYAIRLAADSVYLQGTVSSAGSDSTTSSGGTSQSIVIAASTALHLTGGTIETSGGSTTANDAGADGGNITITSPAIYGDNGSSISASGGDGLLQGGSGGTILLVPPTGIYDGTVLSYSGVIDSTGGSGTSGTAAGGPGGALIFQFAAYQTGGSISIDGGTGVFSGGNSGSVAIEYGVDSIITPVFSTDGGSATGTTGATTGGTGGTVIISQRSGQTGELRFLTSSLEAGLNGGYGGATGGNGGTVIVSTQGSLSIGGSFYLNGGNGTSTPGSGGQIHLTAENDITSTFYGEISGGSSKGSKGGQGGSVSIENNGTGTVTQSQWIIATGGTGIGSDGGNGGTISIASAGDIHLQGGLMVTGGIASGSVGGDGGYISIASGGTGSIVSSATINADGGAREGTSMANGGDGGIVTLQSEDGATTNSGSISCSGGLSYRDTGGTGGYVSVGSDSDRDFIGGNVTNTGTLVADGGLGITGGEGGTIVCATNPDNTIASGIGQGVNSGIMYTRGGPGNNDGGLGGVPGHITCYGQGQFLNTGTIRASYGNDSDGPAENVIID